MLANVHNYRLIRGEVMLTKARCGVPLCLTYIIEAEATFTAAVQPARLRFLLVASTGSIVQCKTISSAVESSPAKR